MNLYGYVLGDPINNTDPLGLVCYALPKEYAESREYREGFQKGMGQGAAAGLVLTGAIFAPGVTRAVATRYPRLFIGLVSMMDETAVVGAGIAATLTKVGGSKLISGQAGTLSREIVNKYKGIMSKGGTVPKIGTCTNKSGTIQIGEGNHRVRAAIELGSESGDWSHLEKLLKEARNTNVDTFPFPTYPLPPVAK
jgi:hypothetical protein